MTASRSGRAASRLFTGLLALVVVGGSLVAATAQSSAAPNRHRYIVQTSSPAAVARPLAKARQGGGTVLYRFRRALSGFTAELTPAQAARLSADSGVLRVVRDARFRVPADEVPGDAVQTGPPWGLDRVDQRSATLDGRYDYYTAGSGTTVFVVDSGVRLTHAEFGGRAVSGYDFVGNDGNASDCFGHGTHVAGTAAGRTSGVAKSARIVSVRVLDCQGYGSLGDVVSAFDWILDHRPSGPAVVNVSLGAPSALAGSELVDQAAAATVAAGITVVAAAGNAGISACDFSPATVPSVITVAASDADDTRADFSNHGSCVDLFAPGVDVRSASNAANTAYVSLDGTSMAAPHVAGAIARQQQDNPLAAPATLAAELRTRATTGVITDPVGAPDRLLYLAPPSQLAGRPTSSAISRSDSKKTITLRWGPPTTDGGATITGYRVIRTGAADGAKKRVAAVNLPTSARAYTFGSLLAGGRYRVSVQALTSRGSGWAALHTTTMLALPGKAVIKKASSGSKRSKGISVTGRWARPSAGGPVASYQVKADRVGSRQDKTVTVSSRARSVKITGLKKNARYTITVRAVNAAGKAAWSRKSGRVTAR